MNGKKYALLLILAVVSGIVGGALFNHFFATEPGTVQVIKTQKLLLVDNGGKIRAEMGFFPPDSGPNLIFYGQEGKGSKNFLAIGSGNSGESSLSLFGGSENAPGSIQLGIGQDGHMSLSLMSGSGKDNKSPSESAILLVAPGQKTLFSFRGKDGLLKVMTAGSSDGKPVVALLDKDGNEIRRAP